jgi:hypothetical protein
MRTQGDAPSQSGGGLIFAASSACSQILSAPISLKSKYFLDLVVEGLVPVELKSIELLLAIHKKQLLSQLRLTNLPVGLLINFNVERLVDGVKRVANPKYRPECVAVVPGAGPSDPAVDLGDKRT